MALNNLHADTDDVGDQIPMPKLKTTKDLLKKIPGVTKFDKFQWMVGAAYSEDDIRKYLNIKTHDQFRVMENRQILQVETFLRRQVRSGHMQNIANLLRIQWLNVFAIQRRADVLAKKCELHPNDRKLAYAESHLRQTLNIAIQLANDLQLKTPLAEGFNQFIKENIIEGGGKRINTNQLPVTPAEITK